MDYRLAGCQMLELSCMLGLHQSLRLQNAMTSLLSIVKMSGSGLTGLTELTRKELGRISASSLCFSSAFETPLQHLCRP
jgi:hypothetical protein